MVVVAGGFVGPCARATAATDNCADYFYFAEGRQIETLIEDGQGHGKGRKVVTVSGVSQGPEGVHATLATQTWDQAGKSTSNTSAVARCDKGELILDLTAALPAQKDPLRAPSPILLRYPSKLEVGQALDDRIDFELRGVAEGRMTQVAFSLRDRRVAGEEPVETPLGPRASFKIASTLHVSIRVAGLAIPMRFDLAENFVPGFGVVRAESFQNGKLTERSVIRFVSAR